jgi:hypothetical protein
MITTSDAMKVMITIQACHPRTAPRMDDREVALATAAVQSELYNFHNLELPDLIAAVKKRAAMGAADAPEPAEVITHARAIRQERNDRLGPTPEYEQRCESKGADTRDLQANRDRLRELTNGFGKTIDDDD